MKTRVLALVFTLFTLQIYAADYYWIGGGGNWSELSHWRLGSPSGSIPSIVPSAADNVYFTASSGFGTTTASRTVRLDGNAFCNKMDWTGAPNNPIFSSASAVFTVEVRSDLLLSPVTTYNVEMKLLGSTNNVLTTNGNVLGSLTLTIDKPGGGITVTDSLIGPSALVVNFHSGTFDLAGKKMSVFIFGSGNNNPRTINFTNADITVGYQYFVTGSNKTVITTGSTLAALGYLHSDFTTYNKVINNAKDAGNFSIFNCSFSTLTFLNSTPGSAARIHDNNTADTIRFMSSGSIGSGNTVKVIIAAGGISTGNNNILDSINATGGVSIGNNNTVTRITAGPVGGGAGGTGTGNTIKYWKHGGPFSVSGGTNVIDSLLLTPGKVITLRGTFNINKYLELNGTTCDAFSEVNGDPVSGSLNFAPGAIALMNNMALTGVKAYGAITPLDVSGIDNGGNAGFNISAPTAGNTTLYWVNGSGDWNDRNHWSASSGGPGGACVPYSGDDVIFDANSGLSVSGTVTTSSSSFCRNMTWSGMGNVTFTESGSYKFLLYGSLQMDPAVTMNALIEMPGNISSSITTNGSSKGAIQFIIDKTNAAIVSLADNWNNPTGGSIVHRNGGLNMSGRTINIAFYSSVVNATRAVDISNAMLNFNSYWDYRLSGKSISSAGSRITTVAMTSDGLIYPLADVTGLSGSVITGTNFGQLTFTNTSNTSLVTIGTGNTIRKLEYKGSGSISAGSNTIDSLILAGSKNYSFTGTNTINKYMKAQSAACAGFSEIKGTPTGTLAFGSGAMVEIDNVYMQNMGATGSITPIAFNGANAGGNTGWTINVAASSPRFWVGGGGDWNDPAHWSSTSGGTAGSACVPTVYDDVYFDANSGFTTANRTVTINNGNAYARNINWTGALNSPVWNKSTSWKLEVWGDSLIVTAPATFNLELILKGSNPAFMKGSTPSGSFDIRIDKPGGSLTLLNDYNNSQGRFFLTNGAFNASGRTLNFNTFTNEGSPNASSVDISNSIITLNGNWAYSGSVANHALNAVNSAITSQAFNATGFTYNKVNVNGALSNSAQFDNTTIDSLVFTLASTTSQVGINGNNNTFNFVEYKGSGGIYGNNNTIDTLVFFPGNRYTLNSGTNTTITGEWYGSGSPCRLTEIVSSSTTNATITKSSGDVSFDYVRLQHITATGSAAFNTQSHSIDLGGNTGWLMAPYDGAAPIKGLGADTMIAPMDWPFVLRTDGFFGAPSSQYTWNDGSNADTLEISEPGTYTISVTFPDGCNISDEIVLTEGIALPVTLRNFRASLMNNCAGVRLNWSTISEQNSAAFIVQRSTDGISWNNITTIEAAGSSNSVLNYSFTDVNVTDNNVYMYLLLMKDIDGRQKNSNMITAKLNCNSGSYFIYGNPVKEHITIQTPLSGGQKILAVYNVSGQRIAQKNLEPGTVQTLDASGWQKGIYLAVITENGKQVYTEKLLKH